MKTLLILIGILLYLLIGSRLFTAGVNAIGGREEYLRLLEEDNPISNPYVIYSFSQFMVIIFWPYFLIQGVRDRRR